MRVQLQAPDLIGHFVKPTTAGEIRLEIKEDRYNPLFVEIRDLPIECDDGTTRPLNFLVKGDLTRDRRFRIDKYFGSSFGGPDQEGHLEVTGRLKTRRTAEEALYYSLVSYDAGYPSCATRPYLPREWRAHHPH